MIRLLALLIVLIGSLHVPITLAAAQNAEPLPGDPVTFRQDAADDTAAGESTVTVVEFADPATREVAEPAPDGTRYVEIVLAIDNGTDLTSDPATYFLLDSEGLIERPLEEWSEPSDTATPAASAATGDLTLIVPVGIETDPVRLFHVPSSDRMILLANLGGSAAASAPIASPTATGEISCDQFESYFVETVERLNRLAEIAEDAAAEAGAFVSDPEAAAESAADWAAELEAIAREQADTDIPAGAEEVNDRLVELFDTIAEGLRQLADGLESFDLGQIQEALEGIATIDDRIADAVPAFTEAAESCDLDTENLAA